MAALRRDIAVNIAAEKIPGSAAPDFQRNLHRHGGFQKKIVQPQPADDTDHAEDGKRGEQDNPRQPAGGNPRLRTYRVWKYCRIVQEAPRASFPDNLPGRRSMWRKSDLNVACRRVPKLILDGNWSIIA